MTPTGSNTLVEQSGSLLGSFAAPQLAINTAGRSDLVRQMKGFAGGADTSLYPLDKWICVHIHLSVIFRNAAAGACSGGVAVSTTRIWRS